MHSPASSWPVCLSPMPQGFDTTTFFHIFQKIWKIVHDLTQNLFTTLFTKRSGYVRIFTSKSRKCLLNFRRLVLSRASGQVSARGTTVLSSPTFSGILYPLLDPTSLKMSTSFLVRPVFPNVFSRRPTFRFVLPQPEDLYFLLRAFSS